MENLKEYILQSLENNKERFMQFGVSKLGVFGSVARNESNEQSDIDFIVDFEPGKKNYKNFIRTYYLLNEIFQRKIDLLTEKSLKPYMRDKILKETQYVSFN
jgi:uncharacterized protein